MLPLLALSPFCCNLRSLSASALDDGNHFYLLANTSRSQLFLGSEDPRSGGGFSLAMGRKEPKLRWKHIDGELVWELYGLRTSSEGVPPERPNTADSVGLLASARYRWVLSHRVNLFGDAGLGLQWLDHTSNDVPLAFNTTPTLALGLEFKGDRSSMLLGVRLLHVSNAGRQNPNPGQNLLQWFVGFRF
jgi:hypothetical protein